MNHELMKIQVVPENLNRGSPECLGEANKKQCLKT